MPVVADDFFSKVATQDFDKDPVIRLSPQSTGFMLKKKVSSTPWWGTMC